MDTATMTELEAKIIQHLAGNPWLTAFEAGRATGHAMGGVRNALMRMQAAGHVESRKRPRHEGDPRPRVEWRAVGYCTSCGRPGQPYTYHGQEFEGLCAYHGDRLCPACRDARMAVEGVNILVQDDRPGREPYVVNSVQDAEVVHIWLPAELRGIDGRDLGRKRRRR